MAYRFRVVLAVEHMFGALVQRALGEADAIVGANAAQVFARELLHLLVALELTLGGLAGGRRRGLRRLGSARRSVHEMYSYSNSTSTVKLVISYVQYSYEYLAYCIEPNCTASTIILYILLVLTQNSYESSV